MGKIILTSGVAPPTPTTGTVALYSKTDKKVYFKDDNGNEAGLNTLSTAADIRGLGFFDITNDGEGSGLDADFLDGSHASAFATSAQGLLANSALQNIEEDGTPQLGAQLDVNGFGFGDGTNILLDFVEDASAVNNIQIENEATGLGPIIRAVGSDTNIDLNLEAKGAGVVNITGAVTVSSTVDGRNISVDGALLDTALQNIVEDGSPQLGGNLDVQSFSMVIDGGNVILSFTSGGEAAVNWVDIQHETAGLAPIISVKGADTNIDLKLVTKGTGDVDVSTNKIVNVVDPTANQDAATKNYVDINLGFDLGEFVVAGLPTASSNANAYALATDASGGRTVVRSDGTDWKVVAVEGATVTV